MKDSYQNVMEFRREVFAEIARIAYNDLPLTELRSVTYRILPMERLEKGDDIFQRRAALKEHLRLTMGLDVRHMNQYTDITTGQDSIDTDANIMTQPLVNVIDFACKACAHKTVMVTDNCRRCLARPCITVCPKNCITMGEDRSHIDHDECIRCKKCVDACPYNAIVYFERPCEASCGVNAIEADEFDRAVINSDKCVACGHCVTECPFGAIADKTQIYQLVKALKREDVPVYATIAPAYVGQFGDHVSTEQIMEAIRMLGFTDVYEVALGADMTTLQEAKEFVHNVPEEHAFMGTSCCYSWTLMIQKMFPEYAGYVSSSGTPMKYTGEMIKAEDPNARICFIGPCSSKKLEAIDHKTEGYVDYVITFEELMGMMQARDINIAEVKAKAVEDMSSASGRGYAIAGGVAAAVKEMAEKLNPDLDIRVEGANSLADCVKLMRLAAAGKKDGMLLEGMACPGGCIDGMGTIKTTNKAGSAVKRYMAAAQFKTPLDNDKIPETLKSEEPVEEKR